MRWDRRREWGERREMLCLNSWQIYFIFFMRGLLLFLLILISNTTFNLMSWLNRIGIEIEFYATAEWIHLFIIHFSASLRCLSSTFQGTQHNVELSECFYPGEDIASIASWDEKWELEFMLFLSSFLLTQVLNSSKAELFLLWFLNDFRDSWDFHPFLLWNAQLSLHRIYPSSHQLNYWFHVNFTHFTWYLSKIAALPASPSIHLNT